MALGIFEQLAWLTKKVKQLCCIVENGGGGGGGTNPTSTYIPYNNTGTFADSYLTNDTANSVLKSVYGGNDIGLKLDFANNEYKLGDFNSVYLINNSTYGLALFNDTWGDANGFSVVYPTTNPIVYLGDNFGTGNRTYFKIDDGNQTIFSSNNSNDIGLKLDFASQNYTLGDYINSWGYLIDQTNGFRMGDVQGTYFGDPCYLKIENSVIKTSTYNDIGLKLDFANNLYNYGSADYGLFIDANNLSTIIGDYGALDFNTYLNIGNGIVKTFNQGNEVGLKLDFTAGTFTLGDSAGANDSTLFGVDNTNEQLLASDNLFLSTPGYTFSDNCIPIFINGNIWYIPLFKP